jgi:hypothetical protein
MSTIKRDANGVMDFLFDKLEEVDQRTDVEFEKKIKLFDMMLKNVWAAGRLNMQYKALMQRAPDIAQNKSMVLQLGEGGAAGLPPANPA